MKDFFNARTSLKVGNKEYTIYRLDALEKAGLTQLKRLPFSIRIVLEAALRQCNDKEITQKDVRNIAAWTPSGVRPGIPFLPARVVMQDFTRGPSGEGRGASAAGAQDALTARRRRGRPATA